MSDDTKIALLENNIGHINKTLERIEKRLDSMDAKIDNGFSSINSKVDNNFKWLIGTMISLFLITVLASFLHH